MATSDIKEEQRIEIALKKCFENEEANFPLVDVNVLKQCIIRETS